MSPSLVPTTKLGSRFVIRFFLKQYDNWSIDCSGEKYDIECHKVFHFGVLEYFCQAEKQHFDVFIRSDVVLVGSVRMLLLVNSGQDLIQWAFS